MGIDLLALSFDMQKQLRVRLDIRTFIVECRARREPADGTVGELWDWLRRQLDEAGQPVPLDLWPRFTAALDDVAWGWKDGPGAIRPEHFLKADLGLTG